MSDASDHAPADDEAEAEGGDYRAPKPQGKAPMKRKAKAAPVPKKPRVPKAPTTKRNNTKAAGQAKPRKATARKGKQTDGEGEYDADRVAKDSKISGDNALFSTWSVMHHSTDVLWQ